jgi:hypothetical protein
MTRNDETLTPQDIAEGYMRSYHALYGRQPSVRHMGGYWYQINGEIVHRTTLTSEMFRLRKLAQQQKPIERSIVQRLITRLKSL